MNKQLKFGTTIFSKCLKIALGDLGGLWRERELDFKIPLHIVKEIKRYCEQQDFDEDENMESCRYCVFLWQAWGLYVA